MRFALFAMGSRGDTQPYLALGRALQAQGHQVVLCLPENFTPFIQGLGLESVPLPFDTRTALEDPGLRRRLLRGDVAGFFLRVQRQVLEREAVLRQAWLEAAEGADILVGAATTDEGLTLLGQALGKPVVYTELTPLSPSSRTAPIVFRPSSLGPLNLPLHWISRQAWWWINRPASAALARALGKPAPLLAPALRAQARGAKVLHGYSPALVPTPADWNPEQHRVTGAWRLAPADAQSLPGDHHDAGFAAWLEDGPPPVFLSFGSMPAMDGAALLELAGDVAETLQLRVVLGAGWSQVDSADCDLPEGVAISSECDHAWLLERCCAVVHHGGAGTTHAAAAAGLPQVVCPFFADQPYWARAVQRSGAGTVLPFRKVDADSLALALERALQDPSQAAATALAEAMHADSGAAGAALQLQRWFC
jgi:UDP:flavonoid glycosyltransferase YjiC (YdhE family)